MKFVVLAVSLMSLAACSKYEDNNFISLRSVEKRLYQRWRCTTQSPFLNTGDLYYTFGDQKLTVEYSGNVDVYPMSLNEDKTEIRYTHLGNPVYVLHIIKLTNKVLRVRGDTGEILEFESE